jgi:Uma2 family endonuclease
LIGGFPVAMAPPAEAHRILAMRLGSRIDAALAVRRPCNAQIEAGVVRADRADTYFEADIVATCESNEPGRQAIKDPFLIVEILSPSTERHDRRVKLPAYRQIPTVQEIVLIASDGHYAELHRRSGAQWITEIPCGADARLALTAIGIEGSFADLYEGIALVDDEGLRRDFRAPYSMTSSARARTAGGIEGPRAFAVFKLTAKSKCVG